MSESAVEYPSTAWERRKIEAMSRIQQVALDLFDEHGYRNVTVERVASAAGVSPSSVYRYFGTKETLVLYDEADPRVLDVMRTAGGGEIVEPAELVRVARLIVPVLIESLLTTESERRIRRRLQYVVSIPEIRDGQTRRMRDMADQFRLLFAERTGRSPDDLAIGIAAAAGVWGCVAALDHWAATGFTERLKDVYTKAIGSIVDSIEVVFR